MATTYNATMFADVDRMDAKAFASHLNEDCVLRFGNADEVKGRAAIEEAIAGFFSTIAGLHHDVLSSWTVGDTTILQLDVTYDRKDGKQVTIPVVTIYKEDGRGISDYRIYIDVGPVYA
jgi:ketosteroid isomerase-like protein